MSGETAKDESAWTIDSVRYHFEQRFADQSRLLDERYATQTKALDAAFAAADKAVQAALLSAEKAVSKAEAASEKRFEAVNEFRGQLNDQAHTFLPRTEYDARHANLEDRVTDLTDRLNRADGQAAGAQITKGSLVTYLAAAVAVLGLIVAAANGRI